MQRFQTTPAFNFCALLLRRPEFNLRTTAPSSMMASSPGGGGLQGSPGSPGLGHGGNLLSTPVRSSIPPPIGGVGVLLPPAAATVAASSRPSQLLNTTTTSTTITPGSGRTSSPFRTSGGLPANNNGAGEATPNNGAVGTNGNGGPTSARLSHGPGSNGMVMRHSGDAVVSIPPHDRHDSLPGAVTETTPVTEIGTRINSKT
jgi:hypothetical protein